MAQLQPSRTFVFGAAGLVAVAGLGMPFSGTLLNGVAAFVPALLVFAAVVEAATYFALVAVYRRSPLRSTGLLAATYAAGALLALVQSASMPLVPGRPPLLPIGMQVAPWIYVVWHSGFSLCALGFVWLRRRPETELRPAAARAFLRRALALLVAGTIVACCVLVWIGPALPTLTGGDAASFRVMPEGPLLFGLSVLAFLAAAATVPRDTVGIALTLALLAFMLDVGLHLVDSRRFVNAWYVARSLYLSAACFVFIGALVDALGWQNRVLRLQARLERETREAEHHAQRLATLWRVASATDLDDDAFIAALLSECSRTLRPGTDFYGILTHLDGGDLVVDVAQASAVDTLAVGSRHPVDNSMGGELLRLGRTASWRDLREDERMQSKPRVRDNPWRAYVGTPFAVGATRYSLSFATLVPLATPLTALDHAYLETIASLCATRLQQRTQRDRLRYTSEHDPLTGILNRASFRARGFDAVRSSTSTAIAVIDVDNFRHVNNDLGHHTGDAVLVAIATGLQSRSARDVVGRLGGNAFGVLLTDVGSQAEIEERLRPYLQCFDRPFATTAADVEQHVRVTASAGIAVGPADGDTFEELLVRADAAVQEAKRLGRARSTFFDRGVEDAFARSRQLSNHLAEALVRDEFELYFQPHIGLADGAVTGAEALIRWRHPTRGLMLPAEFIPFAEEHDLIGAIGEWVMRETLRVSAPWRRENPDLMVWFNLSATELNDLHLTARLRAAGDSFAGVGIEITETVAMQDVRQTLRSLEELRAAGLRIALDDFGTGYSSLAHLKRLPFDVVKIDRTFTAGLPNDPHDVAVVEAVVSLSRHYGFETIAEGVENLEQAAFLALAGCRHAQGYLYAHPMPAQAFERWLGNRRAPSLAPSR